MPAWSHGLVEAGKAQHGPGYAVLACFGISNASIRGNIFISLSPAVIHEILRAFPMTCIFGLHAERCEGGLIKWSKERGEM